MDNMKFLCLILWQGEVCTDTNNDADADEADADDVQSMIVVQGSLIGKPNEPKLANPTTYGN